MIGWSRVPLAHRLLASYVGLLILGFAIVAISVGLAALLNLDEIRRLDRAGVEFPDQLRRVVEEERQTGRLSAVSADRIDGAVDELRDGIDTALERFARTFGIALAAGVSVALGVALLLGPPITRLNLRNLQDVASASRALAGGDLSARARTPVADDEVGDLARAFNQMASSLEAAFGAQRSFVADASHELRTPLTALGGQIDVLDRVGPEEAAELRQRIRREIDRLARLADELLSLTVLDARGPEALTLASVDLADVAHDVVEQVRALPASRGRRLILDALEPVRTVADPSRLHQALLNLVSNAVGHTPPDGAVIVRVERTEQEAAVVVRDPGPGIAEEHLPHIFQRFYRVDSGRQPDGAPRTGSGLGLSIARSVVEAHGGRLSVTSSANGSAFTIHLPLIAPPAA